MGKKSKNKTKEVKAHLEAVASLGCFVCGRDGLVHHTKPRGKSGFGLKSSHFETICLCHFHHVSSEMSIHMTRAKFEAAYGLESDMLKETLELVKNRVKANDFW